MSIALFNPCFLTARPEVAVRNETWVGCPAAICSVSDGSPFAHAWHGFGRAGHTSASVAASHGSLSPDTSATFSEGFWWGRLPPRLLAALAASGIDSPSKLRATSDTVILSALSWADFSAYQDLLTECRRPEAPRAFDIYRLLARCPGIAGTFQISDIRQGQVPKATSSRPTPSQMKHAGWDARAICDAVADARASAGVQQSSAKTYDSHLHGVEFVCGVLGESPLPADLATIRRVSSVVGNPSTLRGWLAAWKRLHTIARLQWLGDRGPFLLAVRTGLRHCVGPPPPQKRCRRALVPPRGRGDAPSMVGCWSILRDCILLRLAGSV